jgi:topoisomerase-4 subunit A
MIYRDGKNGPSYIKRFNVSGVTRDKFYDLTNEKPGSQVLYFSCNPNGEAEVITILLRQVGSIKKLKFDIDFANLAIKGRTSKGNIVTKYPVKKIELKEKGISTLLPRKIWFDDTVQRLNVDARGELLGEFRPSDKILIIQQSGKLKVITPELTTHFDEDMVVLEKWIPKKHPNSQLEIVSTDYRPVAELIFNKIKGVQKDNLNVDIEAFIAVKGFKALGNQLTTDKVKQVNLLEPLPYEVPLEVVPEEIEVEGDEVENGETEEYDDSDIQLDEDGQITLF